jgi:hypothetical protein
MEVTRRRMDGDVEIRLGRRTASGLYEMWGRFRSRTFRAHTLVAVRKGVERGGVGSGLLR